jgi:hypothetical protein
MSKLAEALRTARDALRIGHDAAAEVAAVYHRDMAGYREPRHRQVDRETQQIVDAIAVVDAALAEHDAAPRLTPGTKTYCCYGAYAEVGCLDDCPTRAAPPAQPVPVEKLLEWAVLDGVIRMSKVFDTDLQDALEKFAARFAAPPAQPVALTDERIERIRLELCDKHVISKAAAVALYRAILAAGKQP